MLFKHCSRGYTPTLKLFIKAKPTAKGIFECLLPSLEAITAKVSTVQKRESDRKMVRNRGDRGMGDWSGVVCIYTYTISILGHRLVNSFHLPFSLFFFHYKSSFDITWVDVSRIRTSSVELGMMEPSTSRKGTTRYPLFK